MYSSLQSYIDISSNQIRVTALTQLFFILSLIMLLLHEDLNAVNTLLSSICNPLSIESYSRFSEDSMRKIQTFMS